MAKVLCRVHLGFGGFRWVLVGKEQTNARINIDACAPVISETRVTIPTITIMPTNFHASALRLTDEEALQLALQVSMPKNLIAFVFVNPDAG
jgi:hypothetical protein